MKIGLGIIAGSMLLVVVEALASYFLSQNFWPSQVMARWGKAGIAFFAHGGMWGDFFLLPFLMAIIVMKYGDKWTMRQIAIMALIGFVITTGNHLLLIFTQTIPDPLGWKSEKWSTLIGLHFVYMTIYVALAGLFYFHSDASVEAAVWVSVILGIHMAFGTHVPLGMLNRLHEWKWCPELLHSGLLWMQAVIWIVLAGLSWYATDWRAGIRVGGIGAGFVTALLLFMRAVPSKL